MNIAEYNTYIEKYLKMVYRISFHYFGNKEDAEDVSQDVFVKLYGGNFNPESEEELKAWLIRVTTNACHNYFRNPFRKRKTEIDEKELENIIGTSSSEQEIVNRKVVMDAVMSLPEHYRIIVYLFYYEEYSIGQISKILKIKETTIQTRLSRARGKLKTVLIRKKQSLLQLWHVCYVVQLYLQLEKLRHIGAGQIRRMKLVHTQRQYQSQMS